MGSTLATISDEMSVKRLVRPRHMTVRGTIAGVFLPPVSGRSDRRRSSHPPTWYIGLFSSLRALSSVYRRSQGRSVSGHPSRSSRKAGPLVLDLADTCGAAQRLRLAN